ncbi:hypothetical protein [Frankia sp. Cj3]|uniref:hypothetical protein n=1 Tax=Frankia sp. Cj3 TaxID=2880976 RepID=UPI001EF6EAB0|nr:hypothetical protein [Frankia sp. Cj3]
MREGPALLHAHIDEQIVRILEDVPVEDHHAVLSAAITQARARAAERQRSSRQQEYRADPVRWADERLGVHLWSKQREIITSIRDNRKTAVPSAHDCGKSFTAAAAVAYWLDVHPPGEAFVITTAPTFSQVRAILWREIRQLARRLSPPLGRVNQTEWLINDDLVAFGRKPADHDDSGFQGIHNRYVLVVLDEAGGIPEQLWTAADTIATNTHARILAIGNPDDPTSHFARVCDMPSWNVIRIPADATPAFTGEDVPAALLDVLLSRTWVEEKAQEWGVDNPIYISKILARFPVDVSWKAIRASDIAKCRIGRDEPWPARQLRPVVLGVDIGEGSDMTVVRERRGIQAGREWEARTPEPHQAVDLIGEAVVESGASVVNIDAGGPGWGIAHGLRVWLKDHKARGTRVVPIRFGEGSKEPDKYANTRAELWWGVGRLFSQGQSWDLSAMDNPDTTCAQLCDPHWHTGPGDRIVIESKDEIRKRTGRSPDNADALLLAYAGRGGPATISSADRTSIRVPGHRGRSR